MADRSVTYEFRGKFDNLTGGLSAAGSSVQDFGKKLTALDKQGAQMRRDLGTLGSAAGKMGLVAAGGLGAVTKAAMDWETAWTGVLKTVDGTDAELAKLEGGLRSLAKETGFAHGEVAAVAEAAGQLGISTGGVEAFTQTMLDMGVSTSLSAQEAATGLARFRNIMGITEAEIQNTGSAMVELGNNFATTEGEVLAMSLRVAGAGRQAGLSTSDVLGLSAAMSSVGIEAEAGGTAMSLTMKRIGKEVETGGENLALFAQTAGMTIEQFTQAWGTDAAGTLTKFVAGLGQAEAMGMSTNAVLRELGVTGIREADALLRLSGNAEGLADALDTANEGFRENNALTEEAGKFYGTTGQQVAQAWASIKDAAIDAGAVVLPVVSVMADGVSALAGAYQMLPGPVQGSLTGLLGVGAAIGGSIWTVSKAVNTYADLKGAMEGLSVSSPKTASALGMVGRAAGAASIALAGLAISDVFYKMGDEAIPQLEELRGQLLDLTRATGSTGGLAKEFDSLGDSVERLANANWAQSLQDNLSDTFWGIGGGRELREARAEIEALDGALANMVATGHADLAAEALGKLTAEQKLSKSEIEDLEGLLANYGEAMKKADNDSRLAAGGSNAAGDAFSGLGDDADDASSKVESLADALDAMSSTALDQDAAMVAWKRSIQSLTEELEGGADALDANTEKGQDNRDAIRDRVKALQGMVKADEDAGVAADKVRGKLLNGAKAILEAGKAAGIAEEDMRGYLKQLGLTPKQIRTLIEADVEQAKQAVDEVLDRLRQLRDRTIRVNVERNENWQAASSAGMGGGAIPRAAGGPVFGPGTETSDSIPVLMSHNEHVLSAREVRGLGGHDAVERLRADARAGMWGFASGGALGRGGRGLTFDAFAQSALPTPLAAQMGDLGRHVNALTREFDRAKATVEAERKERDNLLSAHSSLADAVKAQFSSNLWETRDPGNVWASNAWGGGMDPFAAMEGDIAGLREYNVARQKLGDAGLSQAALESILADAGGTVAAAGWSQADLKRYNALYQQRAQLQASAGQGAADAVYGQAIAAQNREYAEARKDRREANQARKQMNRRLERVEKAIDRVGPSVSSGINKSGSRAKQKAGARR